jgi:hypothetical protein
VADPEDRTFFNRVGSIFRPKGSSGGGGFDDFLEDFEAESESSGQPLGAAPQLPRRSTGFDFDIKNLGRKLQGGQVARYFDGDETLPRGIPPHNIAALQRMLVEAGLLKNPRWGFWDPASQNAYQTALAGANSSGTDVQSYLTTYAEAVALGTQEARAPFQAPALELRTTNKQDLHRVFRQAVTELLGVGWTDKQIAELVDAYGWQEIAVQTDAYSQMVERERQLYETGTSDIKQINQVSAPSPETFIENEARRRDPGGFQATQVAEDYAPAFFDALGGYV